MTSRPTLLLQELGFWFFLVLLLAVHCYGFIGRQSKFIRQHQTVLLESRRDYSNLEVVTQFTNALKLAINQKNPVDFFNILAEDVSWENPVLKIRNKNEVVTELTRFLSFFSEPAIDIISTEVGYVEKNSYELNYQLSFYYPLPWRPRIIIPSRLSFSVATSPVKDSNEVSVTRENAREGRVQTLREKWEFSVGEIISKQLFPRFWDVFHTFPTPIPEYPPIQTLQKLSRKVNILEMPATIFYECSWRGPADFPGPPLTVLPDFSFLTDKTLRRKKYYTSLPVEVQSAKYMDSVLGEKMKVSRWRCHVPTSLWEIVMEEKGLNKVIDLELESIADLNKIGEADEQLSTKEEGDPVADQEGAAFEEKLEKLTAVINTDNLNVFGSLKGGVLRLDYDLNVEAARQYEGKQKAFGVYRRVPKRVVASIDISGEVTAEKISASYKELVSSLKAEGTQWRLRKNSSIDITYPDPLPDFALLLPEVKSCWSDRGELAMAYYETHFAFRRTQLLVELEEDSVASGSS